MDILNTSAITNASESTGASNSFVSCSENEVSFDFDGWEINQGGFDESPKTSKENPNESFVFEVSPSFTDPSITLASSTTSSPIKLPPPPEVVQFQCQRRRKAKNRQHSSSPYAQLCFDPNQKILVTMLEIDIVNGRKKHRSRLPLDAPSPEDYFPWPHRDDEDGIPGLTSSSWSLSCTSGTSSAVSGLAEAKEDPVAAAAANQNGHGEPIVLSGWMMDTESMSDEEADIYWLLHKGEDVWVKIDDGCSKALKKLLTGCGQWKVKRSSTNPSQQSDPQDAREEKRFRYSVLS